MSHVCIWLPPILPGKVTAMVCLRWQQQSQSSAGRNLSDIWTHCTEHVVSLFVLTAVTALTEKLIVQKSHQYHGLHLWNKPQSYNNNYKKIVLTISISIRSQAWYIECCWHFCTNHMSCVLKTLLFFRLINIQLFMIFIWMRQLPKLLSIWALQILGLMCYLQHIHYMQHSYF